MTKKISFSELREMLADLDVEDHAIREYLMDDVSALEPFSPRVAINPKLVDDGGLEGDVALSLFNHWAKKRRQRRYRRKIDNGWSGIRIVSEGDSWFQYPFLLDDVIDQLFDDYAIYSLGGAGDLVSDMVVQDEITEAVAQNRPHMLLLSGGGNDLLGNGMIKKVLHPFKQGRPAQDYPNAEFDKALKKVIAAYRTIMKRVQAQSADLKILCHGYDYALPNKGAWLGRPMADMNIKDKALQAGIVAVIIDRFNDAIKALAQEFPGSAFTVNCRNAVAGNQWHDELHPTDEGYASVADRFRSVIDSVAPVSGRLEKTAALCPGREAAVKDARDLEPEVFRQLVARRGRELLNLEIGQSASESKRRETEADISRHFEKISGGADFLPAAFLASGAKRSAAVCRINTPTGSGTGFLISSTSFIMTNNHVIASREEAEDCIAQFHFEAGKTSKNVKLEPDRFFVTDRGLDYTIVGCDNSALDGIDPIPLLRNPSTVTRGEQVNIVQHPRGRKKEVALHNNRVKRVKDKVVHYETDTEPGSSGSSVFNNNWDLVALHHAGWHQPDGTATNEGIRIAAIVSQLIARQHSEATSSNELRDLLSGIGDSSPHLGFFDITGIAGAKPLEVEVPDFKGSVDYSDIGFWNIEHFNSDISDARVKRVAEVLAHLSLDAIGLVEVERPAMDRLIGALRDLGYGYDYKYLNVRGRQDLAVLYDLETTTVTLATDLLQKHRTALGATTRSGRTAFPRRPLIARVSVAPRRQQTVEFIMIAVHLKAFGDAESQARRRLAAKILSEIVEDIRQTENLPVVLGGDLNETLNNDVLDALTRSPDLFTLTSDDADNRALSYVGASHRSLIDHIIVSNDVAMAPISGDDAAIVRLDKSVRGFVDGISDHVPLVMRMVNRDAPLDMPDEAVGNGADTFTIPNGATAMTIEFN